MARRLNRFTPLGVAGAGLIDGINPCAVATLVFLISLLSVAKIRGRALLLVGLTYCLASFLAYMALGFGLLRLLHSMRVFGLFQTVFDRCLFGLLILLAALSLLDAVRYRATQRPESLLVKLPHQMLLLIHRLFRKGLGVRHALVGAFLTGVAVTAVESVCTGQIYVPTLVLMVKAGRSQSLALGYLVLYNVCFIVPLLVCLLLTWQGTRVERLIAWSRRNVVVSKLAMAVLFVVMALLLWWL